jgi:succinate dehydrogenase / fumarate reductase cytochrome b subunit
LISFLEDVFMADLPTDASRAPLEARNTRSYKNLSLGAILLGYRLPLAGIVSILHRASGVIMALLLPLIVWMLDLSLTSEMSYERFTAAFSPVYVKVLLLGLGWAFLHHLCAGVRHGLMDLHFGMSKEASRSSAVAVFVVSVSSTLLVAAKVFGVF